MKFRNYTNVELRQHLCAQPDDTEARAEAVDRFCQNNTPRSADVSTDGVARQALRQAGRSWPRSPRRA